MPGLDHINLNVRDIRRSLRFYQAALGLQVRFWEGGEQMVFLTTPGGNDTVTLCQAGPDDPVGPHGVSHFGFSVGPDLDAAVARAERAGGRVLSRGKHGGRVPFAYVTDPDGYVIELGN